MFNGDNPYVGPRPFEYEDRERYFGRDREARDLHNKVLAHGIILLYARSGAGKSSLLNAGLRSMLENEGFQVLPIARVKDLEARDLGPDSVVNPYVFSMLLGWGTSDANVEALARQGLVDFLASYERSIDAHDEPCPRAVIVDQFEELFTTYEERRRDREDFFRQLAEALAADPLLRVVLSMREDYLAHIDPYAPILDGLRTRMRMEPLTRAGALRAITRPLEGTVLSFAPQVAETLVNDLSKMRVKTESGETVDIEGERVEPVQLQVVCQSLWENTRGESSVITQDHLRDFGDVDQALAAFYDSSIAETLEKVKGVTELTLRQWIESKLITGAGTRGMVAEGDSETEGMTNKALRVLDQRHLIRAERRHGARWYELTHDRFISPIKVSNSQFVDNLNNPVELAIGLLLVVGFVGGAGVWFASIESNPFYSVSALKLLSILALGVFTGVGLGGNGGTWRLSRIKGRWRAIVYSVMSVILAAAAASVVWVVRLGGWIGMGLFVAAVIALIWGTYDDDL